MKWKNLFSDSLDTGQASKVFHRGSIYDLEKLNFYRPHLMLFALPDLARKIAHPIFIYFTTHLFVEDVPYNFLDVFESLNKKL